MIKLRNRNKGFTLVELLLATALFSFILLFVTAAFVQISRAYNKGITVKLTQETTRTAIQEMSRALSTATSDQNSTNAGIVFSADRLCVGDTRFGWFEGFRSPGQFGLLRSDSGECNTSFNPTQSVELIDERLAVQDIQVTEIVPGGVYRLCVVITTNNTNDVTSGNCNSPPECNVLVGDTYCDVARLETTVTLRR